MTTDYQIERDLLLEARNHAAYFQENDWAIGNSPEDDQRSPVILHFCKKRWNYVFSSDYALLSFRGTVLYECSTCNEKAPDHLITIHTMLK